MPEILALGGGGRKITSSDSQGYKFHMKTLSQKVKERKGRKKGKEEERGRKDKVLRHWPGCGLMGAFSPLRSFEAGRSSGVYT